MTAPKRPCRRRAHLNRWLAAGHCQMTLRLHRTTGARLDALCAEYGATRGDIIAGLLLGTIRPYHFDPYRTKDHEGEIAAAMREHGLTHAEGESYVAHARAAMSAVDTGGEG